MLFKEFSHYLEKIEGISSRLEMTYLLAELFKKLNEKEIDKAVYLLQGQLKPQHYGIVLGLGERYVINAISLSTGYSKEEVEKEYNKIGDLGKVAELLIKDKKQFPLYREEMSIERVYETLYKIAVSEGEGSQTKKIRYLAELFNNSSPLEGRYIARIVLGRLRLGIGDATMLDALSFVATESKELREHIERAYTLCSDLGYVAKLFFENKESIYRFKIEVGNPIRPALAERVGDAGEIFERLGKCALEYKYDGFRMQIHKRGEQVFIFSRKLDRIEHMFPDVVEEVKKLKPKEIIFEGEALAFNEEKNRFYSFQETMHRRRKYGIEETQKSYPLYVYVFDVLYVDGKDFTLVPFKERREELEKIFPSGKLKRSHLKIADSLGEIREFFEESIRKGLEGIMAKDLNAPYKAGKRGFSWIKLKKGYEESVDTIDGVVVGYYFGKGSRAKFGFGGLLVAVYNEDRDRFETIAKVGSGFTEEEMKMFKTRLEKIKSEAPFRALYYKEEPDVWVIPTYVVEIAYDEITLSPIHTCYEEENNGKGFALRFPRFIRLREDKDIYEATTSKEIAEMYRLKKGVKQ